MRYSVILGEHNTEINPDCANEFGSNQECSDPILIVTIEEIIIHPRYLGEIDNYAYDIGLIRLASIVSTTEFITPICLPTETIKKSLPWQASMVGWGYNSLNNVVAIKDKTDFNILEREVCLSKGVPLEVNQFCGESLRVGVNYGDSGGPLMGTTIVNGTPYVFAYGILSSVNKDFYIFTDVIAFRQWIIDNIRP